MTRSKERYEMVARCLAKHYETLLAIAKPHAVGAIATEDIVQRAAMITLEHCDRLSNEAAAVAWLRQVTKREGLKISAKRARRARLRAEYARVNAGWVDPLPLSSEFEKRVAEALQATKSLSTDQRRVVHCVLKGLSHKETATELDKKTGAVRVLWHRAIRNLRELLLPPGEETDTPP